MVRDEDRRVLTTAEMNDQWQPQEPHDPPLQPPQPPDDVLESEYGSLPVPTLANVETSRCTFGLWQ
jgi:hypothetical protein